MRFAQAAKPAYKLNGFNVFVIFIALFAIAQLLYPVLSILSMPFLLLAFALFAYLLVKGNTNDLFIFLVLTSLTRIVLPSNFREVSLFIPALIAPVIVAKNLYKFKNMKKLYLNSLLFLFFLFVVIISYQIINKMQLPGFLGSQTGNSGFLNRWNLINNLIVFATVFIGFNMEILNYLIQKISWLYAFVLSVSIMMILFGVNKIPLFNTFSWTVIVENQSSKKMIIAGTAAIMLMLYQLAFKKRTTTWLGILFILIIGVALSGSRTAFLSYFLLLIFAYMIYHRVLIRGILLMILSSGIIFALLLSPLVLLVPDKYQPEVFCGSFQFPVTRTSGSICPSTIIGD